MTEIVMKQLLPFWSRVTAIESPVDDAQLNSGIVIPVTSDEFTRGIIVNMDETWDSEQVVARVKECIDIGSVIYFMTGIKIGDLWVVEWKDILAYEAER